jgi:hypothetical protein
VGAEKVEEILVAKWGGMPTTIALRHRDKFLDSVSKQRYHTAITAKLGIAMPTAEEESASPDKATTSTLAPQSGFANSRVPTSSSC